VVVRSRDVFGVEDGRVAVADPDADVVAPVDPGDGGGGAVAADIDTYPERLAIRSFGPCASVNCSTATTRAPRPAELPFTD
jgi:hypothetical protein